MSEEIPPALLRTGEDLPRPLRVVLPARLGEAGTLALMAKAVQAAQTQFTASAARSRAVCDDAQRAGDTLRQALLRGQFLAWSSAADHLQEHLCDRFDLWHQSEAAETVPAHIIALRAGEHGCDITRPQLPLPLSEAHSDAGGGGRLERLVAVMRARRDQYVALAVQFTGEALDWKNDAPEGEDYDRRYYQRSALAEGFAMAADHLEESLAEAFDALPAYLKFIETHRTWLQRITDTGM